MTPKTIHRLEALRLLEDGQTHKLRLWKLSTGDILTYHNIVCLGRHTRGGIHRVRLLSSGQTREFRDCCLFEIDDLKIFW